MPSDLRTVCVVFIWARWKDLRFFCSEFTFLEGRHLHMLTIFMRPKVSQDEPLWPTPKGHNIQSWGPQSWVVALKRSKYILSMWRRILRRLSNSPRSIHTRLYIYCMYTETKQKYRSSLTLQLHHLKKETPSFIKLWHLDSRNQHKILLIQLEMSLHSQQVTGR